MSIAKWAPCVGVLIQLTEKFEQELEQMMALGFSSGQLACENMDLYTGKMQQRVKRALEANKFRVTAFYCGWSGYYTYAYPRMYTTLGLVPSYLRDRRVRDIKKGAEFAEGLGVDNVLSHIGYIPDNPFDLRYLEIKDCLCGLIEELRHHRQTFLFETGEMLPLTLVQLIKALGEEGIGVNFDPANFLTNGRANPGDALKMLMPYVKGFHVKDGLYPQNGEPKGLEVPLGEGQSDFPKLLSILREHGYTGELTIENEMTGPNRMENLRRGKAYIDGLLNCDKREI